MLLCYAGHEERYAVFMWHSLSMGCMCSWRSMRGCGLELVFNERGVYAIIAYGFKSSVADVICLVRSCTHDTRRRHSRPIWIESKALFFIGVRLNFFEPCVLTQIADIVSLPLRDTTEKSFATDIREKWICCALSWQRHSQNSKCIERADGFE